MELCLNALTAGRNLEVRLVSQNARYDITVLKFTRNTKSGNLQVNCENILCGKILEFSGCPLDHILLKINKPVRIVIADTHGTTTRTIVGEVLDITLS